MQITFDPRSRQDVSLVEDIISATSFNASDTNVDREQVAAVVPTKEDLTADAPHIPEAVIDAQVEAIATMPDTPPAPTTVVSDTELDVNGTPWLEAVHASSKSTIKDGSWRRRKGVDAAVCEAAEVAARGVSPVEMPVAPEMPPVVADPLPQPVDYPTMMAKFKEAQDSVQGLDIPTLYQQAGVPVVDGAFNVAEFATNETLRAKMVEVINTLLSA